MIGEAPAKQSRAVYFYLNTFYIFEFHSICLTPYVLPVHRGRNLFFLLILLTWTPPGTPGVSKDATSSTKLEFGKLVL